MSTPMKLAVLGAGAVTSVGNSLPATAAAIRAGLDDFQETLFHDTLGEPINGAMLQTQPAPALKIGGASKLANALTWAVEEAIQSAGLPVPLSSEVPLLFLGDATRPAPLVEVAQLCQSTCGHYFDAPERLHLQAFTGGEVGCVDALQAARDFLSKGAPYVLVAASDTWLRTADITHGLRNERLLTSDSGNGFIPGEAAAAVLVGPDTGAPGLVIQGLGLAEESAPLLSPEPAYGKGLAQAMGAALAEAGWSPHELNLRISDAAGEEYFAEELSYAWARVLREPLPKNSDRLFPAASLGHIGCATGPLMLALAWQLRRRGRLPGPKLLLQLSSSHTLRGAVAVNAGAA